MSRAALALSLVLLTGCSAFMAGQRSTYRDARVIQVGAERAEVEDRLGPPDLVVPLDDGAARAVYKVDPHAHPRWARNAAVVGHLVADVLTFGLWEIVGTPLELAAQDRPVTYLVHYGKDGRIEKVETIR